jgi:tetratricopeptide (TPR) repeat protein
MNEAAFTRRGDTYFAVQDYEAALSSYTSALDVDRDYYDALVGSGRANYEIGNYDNARTLLERALAQNNGEVVAIRWLGATYNTYEQIVLYRQALQILTDAITIDPNHADAYFERGRSRFFLSDYDLAINDYTRALQFKLEQSQAQIAELGGCGMEQTGTS